MMLVAMTTKPFLPTSSSSPLSPVSSSDVGIVFVFAVAVESREETLLTVDVAWQIVKE